QYYDPAFGALHFGDHRPCVVIAHAINHDDLERLDSLTRRQQGLDSASDELPLVADGHDDADLGRVRHQEPPVASDSPAPTDPCATGPTWLTTARNLPLAPRGIASMVLTCTSTLPRRSRRR